MWCVSSHVSTEVTRPPEHHVAVQYGVATISRLLKIIGLFCKRALLK